MTANIKILEDKDLPAVINLLGQLGYSHSQSSLAKNIASIRSNGGEVFVAEFSEETVGCVTAIIDIRLAEGKTGEIVSLVVSENMRGQGVGVSLMNFAESWLTGRVDVVRVRANEIRHDAHRFYTKRGYTLIKSQKIFQKSVP